MKSKTWIYRQKNDQFVKKAKQLGFVNRAAFKLLEIEQKFSLIKNSQEILELGSSPGGWTQVILNQKKNIRITCIDLLDMKIHSKNITHIKEDFIEFDFSILNKKFDLILSDLAPNTTGHQSTDHLKISQLIYEVINKLEIIMNYKGSLVFKIWKGKEETVIIKILKTLFKNINYFKPKSSRQESSEIFIIANNYKFNE